MSRSHWLVRAIACSVGAMLVSISGSSVVLAAPPSILGMFQERSTAAADEDLVLEAEHGPWLILAMTLSGEEGEAKAIELAKELRTSLRVEAYVHRKEFDYSQPLAKATAQLHDGQQQKLYKTWYQHANAVREKNFAVLVGNYTSPDDPRIADMLKRVKTAKPKCLSSEPVEKPTPEDVKDKDSNWLISTKRMLLWQRNEENAKKGKMGAAFVTRNPLLPDDYFQNAVDDFVVKLNQEVEHSLLRCGEGGARYTVRVATFNGRTVTELATAMAPTKAEEEITDALDEACLKAGQLTAALRAKGVEAYEFHDRTASYVTIGLFDSLGEETASSQFVYNPEMVAIMNQWCGYEMRTVKDPKTGQIKTTPSCKTLDNIPFDVEGKFISVPRPASSKLYGGSLLGKSRIGQ